MTSSQLRNTWKMLVMGALAMTLACTGSKGDIGAKGDPGSTCSVTDTGDGQKIIECGDGTKVTVRDGQTGSTGPTGATGQNGANGANGANGGNGANGTNGKDGSSCTVVDNGDGTKTISCTDGTKATVSDGKPGAAGSCSVATNADGSSTITCSDGSTATVRNGESGDPGRSCTVAAINATTKQITCDDGTTVTLRDGTSGTAGTSGSDVEILAHHGRAFLAADRLANTGKYIAAVAITSATADASGVVTVNFTAKDNTNNALLGLKGVYFDIAALVPATSPNTSNNWMPYLQRRQVVSGSATGGWPGKDGDEANQGDRENTGVLTDNHDGSYKYVFSHKLVGLTQPSGGAAIAYVRSRLHRVALMMGGASGPTASTTFDFVPDGTTATETHDVVQTSTCKNCHGPDFTAHGGDRLTVETCTTCHAAGMVDPQSGNSLDLKTMIHKIHAGTENASAPGADGIFWDDPATAVDESADNKPYTIWGFNNAKKAFTGEFPAVLENCTKCHEASGAGANKDNWKSKPSRAACGSCHDTISFVNPPPAGMTLHPGGPQNTDLTCTACHIDSGPVVAPLTYPIPAVHDFTAKDQRNVPEFKVTVTLSTPANGTSYVAGEAPVATIVVKDFVTGLPIDHTTFVEDAAAPTGDGLEGCPVDAGKTIATVCPPADGKMANSGFFVHGPRARNSPVLTTAARVKVTSTTAGPWDVTGTPTPQLLLKVDGGEDLYTNGANGLVTVTAGNITVDTKTLPTTVVKTAATAQDLADWLNADPNFKKRAIAYLEGGKLSLRSRNKGKFFGMQLVASGLTTTVFGGNTTAVGLGLSTAKNSIAKRISAALNDPKVTWATDKITYQLDPVDDLVPGTYVANVEFQDRGSPTSLSYKTPSVARVTFLVGRATEEPPVAANCNSCHQNEEGNGLVFDPVRHNKHFDFNATDQCTACHDYQNQNPTGNWAGAVPITRRVHAVHRGVGLNFPDLTVGHADEPAGRHWQIEFPQDVRNCQSCHPDGKVSGSWQHSPSRLACGACHDSLPAQNHIKIMTWDPTPADPYSGDEGESCAACHK